MIILFHLKLYKFYYIGAMNKLTMICYDLFFLHIKVNYFFNWQELLQKAKDRYYNCGGKEKAAEYYIENKEVLKENAKIIIETCQKKEEAKREYGKNRYRKWKSKLKEH